MSINETITVGNYNILLLRKNIKNFHLNILPPDGKIRVSVPTNTSIDTVKFFISTRLSWISQKVTRFQLQERESPRKYIDGESHYLLGKRYLLILEKNDEERIITRNKKYIVLKTKNTNSSRLIEQKLTEFYKQQLFIVISEKISEISAQMDLDEFVWNIRKMKVRWGSCNQSERKIVFNIELARVSEKYIEYVIVHELSHLIERNHNDKFISILQTQLPNWRELREGLNKTKLSNTNWNE